MPLEPEPARRWDPEVYHPWLRLTYYTACKRCGSGIEPGDLCRSTEPFPCVTCRQCSGMER